MKTLLTLFILFFSSSVVADDISDFKIEGMSVGDSLLDFFSEQDIKQRLVDFYPHIESKKYMTVAFEDKPFKNFKIVDIIVLNNDLNYEIFGISGVTYFGDEIIDIDDCYNKQAFFADKLENNFTNFNKYGPNKTYYPLKFDPTGKSSYTDIFYELSEDYLAGVTCIDYDESLPSEYKDFFSFGIRHKDFDIWIGS